MSVYVCPEYSASGKRENRNGTVSDFCTNCQQPYGYHKERDEMPSYRIVTDERPWRPGLR